MDTTRLDILVAQQLNISREKAKELIKSRKIKVDGKEVIKPAAIYSKESKITRSQIDNIYVSRGGYKLEGAIQAFNINLENKVCLDIGASTGGFTDCLLQHKAKLVYAVDVGTNQLDKTLRANANVISFENYNIRNSKIEDFSHIIDFIVIDVSFVSVIKVLESAFLLLKNEGELIMLIKPQFETKGKHLNKRGIVKDNKIHNKVLDQVLLFAKGLGFKIIAVEKSKLKGKEGNIEYLAYLIKRGKQNV